MNIEEVLKAHGIGSGSTKIPIHKAGIAASTSPVWELIAYGRFQNANRTANASLIKMDGAGDIYFISNQPTVDVLKIIKVSGQTGAVLWRSIDTYRMFDVDPSGNVFGITSTSTSQAGDAKMRKLNSTTGEVEWEYALIPPAAWTGSYPVGVWAGGGNNVITAVIGQEGVNEFFTGVSKSTGVASFRDVNLRFANAALISPVSGDMFGTTGTFGSSISRYSNTGMTLVSNVAGGDERLYLIGLVGDTAYWVEANVAGTSNIENAFTIRRGEGELVTGIGVGTAIGGQTISCTPNNKFVTVIEGNKTTGAEGGTASDRMITVIDHKTSAQFTIFSPRMGILGIPAWIGVNGELITIDETAKKLRKYKLNIIKN